MANAIVFATYMSKSAVLNIPSFLKINRHPTLIAYENTVFHAPTIPNRTNCNSDSHCSSVNSIRQIRKTTPKTALTIISIKFQSFSAKLFIVSLLILLAWYLSGKSIKYSCLPTDTIFTLSVLCSNKTFHLAYSQILFS